MGLKLMVAPLHGIGLFKTHRAFVLALVGIAVPFAGTLGITIMSAVFNNTSGKDVKHSDYSEDSVESVKNGVVWASVSIIPFMALSCIACLFMGNVILGKEESTSDQEEDVVIREPYLWYLIRGRSSRHDDRGMAMKSLHQRQPYEAITSEAGV